jgi:hypothetical protein
MMNWYHREPTLNEILSDCIVKAVMEADGIDPQELAATLKEAGRLIRRGYFSENRYGLFGSVDLIDRSPCVHVHGQDGKGASR